MNLRHKDKSITDVVRHLTDKFGAHAIKIKDHWDADLCAIGLTDPSERYLIYISTRGKKKHRYAVALENPSTLPDLPYEPGEDFDDVDLPQLEEQVARHLRITPATRLDKSP